EVPGPNQDQSVHRPRPAWDGSLPRVPSSITLARKKSHTSPKRQRVSQWPPRELTRWRFGLVFGFVWIFVTGVIATLELVEPVAGFVGDSMNPESRFGFGRLATEPSG